jgi:hypothetical protein
VLFLATGTTHAGEGDLVCKDVWARSMPDTITNTFDRPPRKRTKHHIVEFSQTAVRAADGTIFSAIHAVKFNGKRCREGE